MLHSEIDELNQYYRLKSQSVIIYIDRDQKIVDANEWAKHFYQEDLIGKPLSYALGTTPSGIDLESLSAATDKKHMFNLKLNRPMPLSYHFSFVKTDDGYLVIGEEDFHEIENLRNSLIETNGEINNLMREVNVKNRELKNLNQLKNQFLGIAAHDLRNPIAAIGGYADCLLFIANENLNTEQKEMIESVKKTSSYMLSILGEFLDITKIESGRIQLDIVDVDIEDLMKQAVRLNEIVYESKKIRVVFEAQGKIPTVRADAVKLEQVFNNLISNAIKFSNPESKISISCFASEGKVVIAVKDEGPGIPEEELPKLFRPYTTTSVKSTAVEKSTGLGLAIVQKVVMAHQGRIWVKSTVGQGSTFFVSLPEVQTDR